MKIANNIMNIANRRIPHSGSKAHDKRDSRNHGLLHPSVYVALRAFVSVGVSGVWSPAAFGPTLSKVSCAAVVHGMELHLKDMIECGYGGCQ